MLDPDCDKLVEDDIGLHFQKVELAKLHAEKARLDGEKARLDLELVVQSHVGGAITLVDTMNYALLQTPENGLRKAYLTSRLPTEVVQFITDILAKVDAKRPVTQSDLREFDALYQAHTRKAEQLIKDNPQLGNIKVKDYLLRIQIAYTTVRPRYDAAVSR